MPSRAMIVVGGGSSERFGADKLLAEIDGRPLVAHTIDGVAAHVDICVVVCRREVMDTVARLREDVMVVAGGATRTLSEMAGLSALDTDVDLIGIHDAARPLIDGATIERLYEVAKAAGGVVPLLAEKGLIVDRETLQPMAGLHRAQTPQVFRGSELRSAYALAGAAGFEGHDTVEVMQRFSDVRVVGIQGDPSNVKVTYPGDLELVRSGLSGPSHT